MVVDAFRLPWLLTPSAFHVGTSFFQQILHSQMVSTHEQGSVSIVIRRSNLSAELDQAPQHSYMASGCCHE
jgi:hypothetical protein